MARRDAKPRNTKERILEAALAEFSARGYAEASIDEIAARAGVTKGAVYYWFHDKVDLARDLQARLAEQLAAQAMRTVDPADDTITNLVRGFETWLASLREHDSARFFLRDCWAIPELLDSRRDEWIGPIRDMLADGVARGDLVPLDPDALAHVLIGAWAEATLHVLRSDEQAPTVATVKHLVESLVADRAAVPRRGARARTRT